MTDTASAPAHQAQLEKLARRGVASVFGAAFSAVSGVALVVIITRGFSADIAGTLFAATSAFLIVEAFVLLGTDTGLVRWLPAQLASSAAQDVRRTLRLAFMPVLLVSLATAVALFIAAPQVAPVLVGSATLDSMTTILRVLAVVLPVAATHDVLLAASRGLGTMRPTVLVENIGRLALQAAAVLVAYLAGAGTLGLAIAWAAPYAAAWCLSAWWVWRLLRQAQDPHRSSHQERVTTREFWAYTGPRAVARVTQTALKRADIVLVAALASPADAALYTAATRFVVLGQLLVQSVQQALAPQMSGLFARGEKQAADSVFKAATVWSMLPSWPIYLLTAAFAPVLMKLFGAGYEDAAVIVVILSLTMLFATACGPVDSVLLMSGHSMLSLLNSTVALIVNVALNVALIPPFGIKGAAIAWSVAIVVRNVLPLVQVKASLGLWPVTPVSVHVAVGSLLCFGSVALAAAVTGPFSAITIALLTFGSPAFLALVYVLRDPIGLDAFRASLTRRRPRRAGA
jgi:O-antigen/teichoic acid export membrane protein